jgi:hypothetical protein
LAWGPGLVVGSVGQVRLGGPDGPGLTPGPPALVLRPGGAGAERGGWRRLSWDSAEDQVWGEWRDGDLRYGVRHHVGEHWDLRLWLANDGPQAVLLGPARLSVEPGEGLAWVWPGGTAGLIGWSGPLDRATGPWRVGLRVRLGQLDDLDRAEPILARPDDFSWLPAGTTVGPGQQVACSWQGRTAQSWAELGGWLPHWLPPLDQPDGAVVELDQPDAVLEAPDGRIEVADGLTYLTGQGRVAADLSGPRGAVRLDLNFARPPGLQLERWRERLLDGRLTPDRIGAGLLVAGWARPTAGPDWTDLVEGLADRAWVRLRQLAEGAGAAVGELAFLSLGLLATTPELPQDAPALDLIGRAVDRASDRAGLGLAWARLWLAALTADLDRDRLLGLVERTARVGQSADWLADLEWRLACAQPVADLDLVRLTHLVGAGLPGKLVGQLAGLPVDRTSLARAVAVSALAPEGLEPAGGWPASLAQSVQAARWRLQALPDWSLETMAWLALGDLWA